jgi:hypothetical protein
MVEYAFFMQGEISNDLKPIKIDELSGMVTQAESKNKFNWEYLKKYSEEFLSLASDSTLKGYLKKLIDTINDLQSATDNIGRIDNKIAHNVKRNYDEKELGLKKWASKICDIVSNDLSSKHSD